MIAPRTVEILDRQGRGTLLAAGLLAVVLVGLIHGVAGWQFSFELFYVLPIIVVSFHAGGTAGALVAIVSAVAWLCVELLAGAPYPHALAPYWNGCVHLAVFLVISTMLVNVRRLMRQLYDLAATDPLTGCLNGREFYQRAEAELRRAARSGCPLALAYLDLDNFKTVNDTGGHALGDEVLRTVAVTLRNDLRQSDLVARLGGDEFGILLPDSGAEAAADALGRARGRLSEEMRQRRWPVTGSIGAVVFLQPPASVDDMVSRADALMYAAKRDGKDLLRLEVEGQAAMGEAGEVQAAFRQR